MTGHTRITAGHVLIAFGMGALSACIASWGEMGLSINTIPFMLTDPTLATIFLAVIIAPIVEEMAKPLGLYLLQGEERPRFTVRQWTLMGAIAGFGFATIENILYAASVYTYGADASLWLFVLRAFMPLHMIATALVGMGYGLWVKTKNPKYFAASMVWAMLLHALFNLSAVMIG